MDKEDHAFYVVRKGNIVSIYRNFSDCQAQVSSSVCDPPVSVYKGYYLSKKTEDYLASHGVKNASYAINEGDVKEDLFGALVPCRFQATNSTSVSTEGPKQPLNLGLTMEAQPLSHHQIQCIIEFDGASKGNPGKAGAGAVIRTIDGHVLCLLREGLGVVTNNVAEYRGLILGMKCALRKGFKHVRVTGDSQLVCMQVQGRWQTKHQNMIELCKEVKQLEKNFLSFQINHVRRDFNSLADVQANIGINLPAGQISEEQGQVY
ncbi:uncharacterized protein LOC109836481 isoform X2 [Asparagus officinalis]|uniref:uncharacterized protein LOC109836481 isoform X2 n=1 Tax=Asparagus officinalis TaxID=4686 RepID=UPI00098E4953|nr:uncharacterized protein LOC109836481 isoform X2 [Asparagus officinalis]